MVKKTAPETNEGKPLMSNRRKPNGITPKHIAPKHIAPKHIALPIVNGHMSTPDAYIARERFISILESQIERNEARGAMRTAWEYAIMAAKADQGFWIAGRGVWAFVIPQSNGTYIRYTVLLEADGPRVGMQGNAEAREVWAASYPAACEALAERMADPDFSLALKIWRLSRNARSGEVA